MRRATVAKQLAETLGIFQSTLSVRRATSFLMSFCKQALFQSTLSVRRATDLQSALAQGYKISIHALREESDDKVTFTVKSKAEISIHALREESDVGTGNFTLILPVFQSTLSVRRATLQTMIHSENKTIISIHALREESDAYLTAYLGDMSLISIHALREESDICFLRYLS